MVGATSNLAAQVLGTRINGLRAWQEQIDRSAHQRRFQNDRKQLDHNYPIIGQQPSIPIVRNSHRAEQSMPAPQKSAVDLWANFINTNANRRAVFEAMMLMNNSRN